MVVKHNAYYLQKMSKSIAKIKSIMIVTGKRILEMKTAASKPMRAKFPEQMEVIEDWKNPPDDETLTDRRRRWAELAKETFPEKFVYEVGKVDVPFPILMDTDRELSQRLLLFTENWDRAEGPQNVPTIFLLDGDGVVQFKYHSQTTFDRPDADYLASMIERLFGDN